MEATVTKKNADRYIEAVGRRKTAIARVRIFEAGKTSFDINEKEMEVYFPTNQLQVIVRDAFTKVKLPVKFKVTARIHGGGINSQAEALRHGIARALIAYDATLRKEIKPLGFL